MPIIDKNDETKELLSPGVDRWALVDGTKGAESLSVGDVVLQDGGKVPNHIHPTEEAMVIVEGGLRLREENGDFRFRHNAPSVPRLRATTDLTSSTMASAVRPYFCSSSSALPDSA